jgi:hypothetical protein
MTSVAHGRTCEVQQLLILGIIFHTLSPCLGTLFAMCNINSFSNRLADSGDRISSPLCKTLLLPTVVVAHCQERSEHCLVESYVSWPCHIGYSHHRRGSNIVMVRKRFVVHEFYAQKFPGKGCNNNPMYSVRRRKCTCWL